MVSLLSISNIFIAIMLISFILQVTVPGYQDAFVFSSERALFDPWRFFTANFLHFNIIHLFLNVYSLFIIGNAIETVIKKSDFLKIFFLGSALIYFEQWLAYSYEFGSYNIGLGSSGGISALLAAAAFLMPGTAVKVFFIPVKIRNLAIIFFVIEFILFAIGNTTIAHDSHLIGGLFGLIYAKFFVRKS